MPITSSSISSSDRPWPEGSWRAFARSFAAAALALLIALVTLSVVLDPYDTGRFALLRKPGVPEQGPRTANVSRGRDPAFDGAIIGNSHIQLVSPEVLMRLTGIPFVSLIVPATGPKEQFVLLDYFLEHRIRPVRALVFGLDGYWCTSDSEFKTWKPFPFWLYDRNPGAYLVGLMRYNTLERLVQRLQFALGLSRRSRARPDGYWDYEQYRQWRAEIIGPELAQHQPSTQFNGTGHFPAIDKLGEALARLPADLAVILVRPPVYITSLPEPGSDQARSEEACFAALRNMAAGRPRTALVDWRTDRLENRVLENYFDHTHYRAGVARAVERDIAEAIGRLAAKP